MFIFKSRLTEEGSKPTKKTFLRKIYIARLFDPLEFLSPFVIRAKKFMQEMWKAGRDWNDQLLDNLIKKMKNSWLAELDQLQNIRVPGSLQQKKEGVVIKSAHLFGCFSRRLAYSATE